MSKKRKLLVVVGSGASVNCGMPLANGVTEILSTAAQDRYPLFENRNTNLYRHFEATVADDWKLKTPHYLEKSPNFEDILYAIFALAQVFPAGQFTSPLGAFVNLRPLPNVNLFQYQRKQVDADVLREFGHFLVDSLLIEFRKRCRAIASNKPTELAKIKALFAALSDTFEIAVITLNYDDIVYRAAPGLETGFEHNGRFVDERLTNRSAWPCILHVHGSVHFDMRDDYSDYLGFGGLHDIHWQDDLDGQFHQNAAGRSSFHSVEGADFPTSVLVAGYGKTTQILRRPFRTYFAEIDRLVSVCDAALFLGYGFLDTHLNFAFEKFRNSRQRPVVVIDHAEDDAMTASGLNMADKRLTAASVLGLFRTQPRSMTWLGHGAPDTVAKLKKEKEFELSSDPGLPLAIWYNGMLDACDNTEKILKQLH